MNILLFGGGLQALSIARSLTEVGHTVDAMGTDNQLSRRSRYIRTCHDVKRLENLQVSSFISDVERENYAAVIPMEDIYADWLSKNKAEIEKGCSCKCAVEEGLKYQTASDKTKLLEFCRINSIPHPKTCPIGSNLEDLARHIGFPSLIKPSHSMGARGIKLVRDFAELQEYAPQIMHEYGACALQEYISSLDYYYNVMMFRNTDGTYANHCIIKILRFYPIKGGSSSLSITVENDKLLAVCKQLLDAIDWNGFADIDVLPKGENDYRVIEINPRVPASVRAAAVSGINYGDIIVRGCLGMPIPQYHYRTNVYLRCLGLDLAWFAESPKRWSAKPSWFRFFGKDLYYQEGGKSEWKATVFSLLSGVAKMLNPKFRKAKSGLSGGGNSRLRENLKCYSLPIFEERRLAA